MSLVLSVSSPVEISDLLSILHSCLGLDIGSKTQIQILHPTVIARNLSVKSRRNVVILTASYSTLMQYARCTVLSQNYPLSAISAAMLSSTLRKSSPSRISCHTNRTQITTVFQKLWRSCSAHSWKNCKGKNSKALFAR